jgi:tRNA/tmRNA/rRNA uracil-C5-methylase (TrmA/RlmC/RlmD family)
VEPARPASDQELELAVGDVAQGGWCVAREPGGRVVLVRHTLPGERVLARLTESTAKLARAEAVEILEASPDRVEPPCPHAHPGGCGGCDWQHASLPAQRRFKAAVIAQQLRRIAGLDREVTVEPLPGDEDGLGWRTRVRFAVRADGLAGLRRHRSHEILDIGTCPIAHPLVNESGITQGRWPGAESVAAVTSPSTGERAVVVSPGRPPRRRSSAGRAAAQARGRAGREPGPRSVDSPGGWNPSGGGAGRDRAGRDRVGRDRAGRDRAGRDRVSRDSAGRDGGGRAAGPDAWAAQVEDPVLVAAEGSGLTALRGGPFLRRTAAGRTWRTSAGVFWQVHPAAADVLAGLVGEILRPQPGDVALDLYCGAGLFAGVLASAVGPSGTVIGFESDPAAVRDARHNLRDTPWARIHKGDVAEVLGHAGWAEASLAVLDPPRAGVARPVLDQLLRAGTALRRVAYVSCDPATLARDIAVFAAAGWELGALRAFDAFPMTHHVECVATLTRAAG